VQPLPVRSHSLSELPAPARPRMPVSSYCWRSQSASLIRRSDPQCPHPQRCRLTTLPCRRHTWSASTKTLMPSNICGLPHRYLGCMRRRLSLSTLLHQYWSRSPSPSLFLGLSDCSTADRYPCPLAGCCKEHTIWPDICKPPNSPPTTDKIERAYLHLMTA
jgi:hypothetical protein